MNRLILCSLVLLSLKSIAHDGEDHRHLDPALIRNIFQSYNVEFSACYQKELDQSKKSFDFSSKVTFTIDPDGATQDVKFDDSSKADGIMNVQKCIASITKGITYPKPSRGKSITVSQPLNFKAKN